MNPVKKLEEGDLANKFFMGVRLAIIASRFGCLLVFIASLWTNNSKEKGIIQKFVIVKYFNKVRTYKLVIIVIVFIEWKM